MLLAALSVGFAASAAPNAAHIVHIPFGSHVSVAQFGGPDVEVKVHAREMTYLEASVTDNTKAVPFAKADSYEARAGFTRAVARKKIEKKGGVKGPEGRMMYELYRDPSGFVVFWVDWLGTPQNHDTLAVLKPSLHQ